MSTTQTGERRVIGNVLKGSVGNLIEWYDWYVYAAFSVYFAKEFFPEGDTTAQLLSTAAVFAVGFLMRPIGGWVMGRYADRHGRRSALTLSVTVMAAGSLVIALTPSYDSVGLVAPVLLVLARMLQGLSVGGEYATSATYLAEVASPGRRGFYSSFQYVTLVAGQLFALGVQIVLQLLLPAEAMQSWGWRIPFVIGAAGAVAVMWLRRTMDESEAFTDEVESKRDTDTTDDGPKEGSLRMLLQYPRECLLVCALTLGGCVAFYTYTTYMQKFMINTSGISKDTVAWINFAALLVFIVLQPLGGALSDRIGRRKLLIFFGVGGTLLTVPLMTVLGNTSNPLVAFGLMMLGLTVVTGYTSVNAIVKTELFPTKVRALGVGLPYALTLAIFGGTVETVALALKRAGHESLFFYYVTGCIAISLVVYVFMRETSEGSPLDRASSRADSPDDDVELVHSRG
ncbi:MULTISPECIES: MFS transporter [Rhodococcus]|uniref:Putative proline/betaine transporter n=1 Tax=Rhodococcus oxybenzonivorans TaxID=1990687 RepID=A0AAE4V2T9_9NOCA|nr:MULTISPECIES: MFS transporter [Rhodococcus]MDV7246208.1 MFS transporter [Rhodococcus oxybenzonivorans]MDV7267295.1 MFS transporter [Rhodococcus oxybenzonivorans]MDV7277923.1 MFS transporter [Rhodococcus oxybenzonivorans]MDV7337221.1 MFS transporter [Rhodococcus oxybenzonivorans]MDV7347426.1 MFS transporter [Rhodococcus oxybenzonivorans]